MGQKIIAAAVVAALALVGACSASAAAAERPNILWITSEDHNLHMGCYGDSLATTPNVDRLAAQGMIYLHAWSNAPVCAPARTTIISGLYATSAGGEHMRSQEPFPAGKKMFPQFLREAGYYCTNNMKEDYNLEKPGQVWDDSSRRAHWRNRRPGQPFFAVFNSEKSHESRIRTRPHQQVHDPAKVRVPAYHPDVPEVRRDWAQYYDAVSEADADAGKRLQELDEAGLAEDTIVFYYGDNGSGMPRSKRWPYNSGLQVPLVVRIPQKFRHLASPEYKPGAKSDRLVSFVDLAPTVLSLAGVRPPEWMQGHAFLGAYLQPPQPYLYGFRGRMDARYDMVRSVTDGRYVYVRNYLPHLIYGQYIAYMFATPTTQVWKKLYDEGKLSPPQRAFWEPKPAEELYDLTTDPDEVKNLAESPQQAALLDRLRSALREHTLKIRDAGFLTEAEQHSRAAGASIYDMAHDTQRYPLERILAMAETAASRRQELVPQLNRGLSDRDSGVRYWAAIGFLVRGPQAVKAGRSELLAALKDSSPSVRVAAAQAVAQHGEPGDRNQALAVLVALAPADRNGVYVSTLALNALDALGNRAASIFGSLKNLPTQDPGAPARVSRYPGEMLKHLLNEETAAPDQPATRQKKSRKL